MTVDTLERTIVQESLYLLALQQPVVASDLRFVSMAMKATTDIERIGDHCVNIAKTHADEHGPFVYVPLVDIERLGRIAQEMLHSAITAFVQRDVDRARAVIDNEMRRMYCIRSFSGNCGRYYNPRSRVRLCSRLVPALCRALPGADLRSLRRIAEWIVFSKPERASVRSLLSPPDRPENRSYPLRVTLDAACLEPVI